ncbi:START domain containing 14 isoform 1-T1 [Spinachia spinachia]
MSLLPDDATFAEFKKQCLSTDNWANKYDKNGVKVWVESPPADKGNHVAKVHKIKCSMTIDDVSAASMYDVVHDGVYRKEWDPAMMESYDVARLSANADVGYYSWRCIKPIKNRDVVTLRSWQVKGDEYFVINFSVKHPKHPPCNGFVRAISILTGYFIKATGPNSCTFIYLSQADPKGDEVYTQGGTELPAVETAELSRPEALVAPGAEHPGPDGPRRVVDTESRLAGEHGRESQGGPPGRRGQQLNGPKGGGRGRRGWERGGRTVRIPTD